MKFWFISLRRNILPFIFVLLIICMLIFSKTNLIAAKDGLTLWANHVVPSLFPFFVMTELLSHTNLIYYVGRFFDKLMRPLFRVPGECAFAFILGFISGYPTGGRIVASMREQGICTKDEGERMLAFTNNSGPLFIISFVGISLFGDTKTGILLLCTHILASITVGIVLSRLFAKKYEKLPNLSTNYVNSSTSTVSLKNLGSVLGNSIQNATSTILLIGGFVVMFSVFLSILNQCHILDFLSQFFYFILRLFGFSGDFAKPILSGMIELTNGVNMVSHIPMKAISQNVILCAFLLGFGGISVLFQVFSMISKTDLSMKKYIIGKLLQGVLAAFYTFLALQFLPFLNLDIHPVFAPIADAVVYPIQFFGLNPYICLFFVLLFIVCIAFSHSDKSKSYQARKMKS